MTKQDDKKDISLVTGGSARKIYDTAQALVKEGKLDPSMALTRKNAFQAAPEYLFRDDTYNLREKLNSDRVRLYADRYKQGKSLPPLVVLPKNGKFQVIDGHHRHAAIELALSEGAIILRLDLIEFDGDENDALLFMMNSAEGERLTALEKAGGYKRLLNQGMKIEEIAEARTQSPLQIKKMLMLANAPLAVKDAVRKGQISATAAIDILVECEKTGADATLMLGNAQAVSKTLGKGKVTGKSIKAVSSKPAALPRKHVATAISTIMSSSIASQLREALPQAASDDNGVISIKLPANMGRELLEALAELEKAKSKAEELAQSSGDGGQQGASGGNGGDGVEEPGKTEE